MQETNWAKAHWAKTTTKLSAINNMQIKSVIGNLNIEFKFCPKSFGYKWHWHSWIRNSSNHRQNQQDHRKID